MQISLASGTPNYGIEVPAFEGPLDLLLHLIERSELDITAISLAKVTDQYLAQIEALKKDRVPQLIDFIVIGARLMVIKSRALLPTPPVVLEGEEEEEDPAEALIRQLKLYKQFKGAAAHLNERQDKNLRTYLRLAPPPKLPAKLDMSNVDEQKLHDFMMRVMIRYAQRQDSVSVVAPRSITIEQQIDLVRTWARRQKRFQFDDLLSEEITRQEIGVTLLALLEMIKRKEVSAEQNDMFGTIHITRRQPTEEDTLVLENP